MILILLRKGRNMKKLIVLALLMVFIGTGAFAFEKAIGGGVLYNYSNSVATMDFGYGVDMQMIMSRNGFGGFAFFGLGRFVELNLGFLYKNPNTLTMKIRLDKKTIDEDTLDLKGYGIDSVPALQFGAYFKYPFVISDRLVLFPTVGMDYELTLKDDEGIWWDDLWLRGGAGFDIFFSSRAFLRLHAIYGIGVIVAGDDSLMGTGDSSFFGWDKAFSHGLLLKVGIGFMF